MKLSHLTLALIFLFTLTLTMPAQSAPDVQDGPAATRKKPFRPTKSQITQAQEKLKAAGNFSGEVSGKYSNDFRAALSEYQTANGLDKTGKLDEPTLEKLGIPLSDRQMGIEPEKKTSRRSFRVTKEQITAAQEKLKDSGLYSGEITGKYSKAFRDSIKEYQSANGLRRKGSLNRATLEKLEIPLTDIQKEIPVNPNDIASSKSGGSRGPVFRATKNQIVEVQKMLSEKNLYSGEPTGKLNKETREAIKTWQRDNDVKVTGTLNKVTLEAMGIALTDKQKAA